MRPVVTRAVKMLRTVAAKVARVGRTASMVFGLALVMALVVGGASTAWSATGGNFILGEGNVATAITKLAGAAGVDGPMLQIRNNNADPNDTALDLRVQTGEAPMTVNSDTKVANLNADTVDGTDASQLATNTSEEWHEIGASGEPTFGDGWSNGTPPYICSVQSSGCPEYNTAGFYKDSLGVVHLKGSIKLNVDGGGSTIAFRLPEGYRPAQAAVFDPPRARSDNHVFVLYDGYFQLGGDNGFSGTYHYSLDGITFKAEN